MVNSTHVVWPKMRTFVVLLGMLISSCQMMMMVMPTTVSAATEDKRDTSPQYDPITMRKIDLPGKVTKYLFNGKPLADPYVSGKPGLSMAVILYPNFELLDVAGPLEFLSYPSFFNVTFVAKTKGFVKSSQVVPFFAEKSFDEVKDIAYDVLMIPGGTGTFTILNKTRYDTATLNFVKNKAKAAKIVFTVCSGSAILARTGLLNGLRATTNKFYYDSLIPYAPSVKWVRTARWVQSGKYITSSGVSAGMDAAVYLIRKTYGDVYAFHTFHFAEYTPTFDSANDPFANQTEFIVHGTHGRRRY